MKLLIYTLLLASAFGCEYHGQSPNEKSAKEDVLSIQRDFYNWEKSQIEEVCRSLQTKRLTSWPNNPVYTYTSKHIYCDSQVREDIIEYSRFEDLSDVDQNLSNLC